MDPTTPAQDRGETDGDGQYVARAQALMARRAELFATARVASPGSTRAYVPTAAELPQRPRRTGGRQLNLPIARERSRRRARMLR